MRIRRGPKTGTWSKWTSTDDRPLNCTEWKPGVCFYFDGTKNKKGSKHSAVTVEVTSAEVFALNLAMVKAMFEDFRQILEIADNLEEPYESLKISEISRRWVNDLQP